MTLLDVAMAHAARSSSQRRRAPGVVTIEMKTSFMRPATAAARAASCCTHGHDGVLRSAVSTTPASCAHATGTFKYLRDCRQAAPVQRPTHPIEGDR